MGSSTGALISCWRRSPEMPGSIEEIDHLMRRPDCQRMLGESWPGKNVGSHLTSKLELSIGCLCEER